MPKVLIKPFYPDSKTYLDHSDNRIFGCLPGKEFEVDILLYPSEEMFEDNIEEWLISLSIDGNKVGYRLKGTKKDLIDNKFRATFSGFQDINSTILKRFKFDTIEDGSLENEVVGTILCTVQYGYRNNQFRESNHENSTNPIKKCKISNSASSSSSTSSSAPKSLCTVFGSELEVAPIPNRRSRKFMTVGKFEKIIYYG